MDAVCDLGDRYHEMADSRRSGRSARRELVEELGGTPAQVPATYARRSPLDHVAALAFGGLPLQIWWSRCDRVVIDQAQRQSGLLFRRIKQLNRRRR